MNTIMFIKNIEHSYIMVSTKYANFLTFFSREMTNVSRKFVDKNKRRKQR